MNLFFCKADLNDTSELANINQELLVGNDNRGFLRQELNFRDLFYSQKAIIFKAILNNFIIGYIVILPRFPEKHIQNLRSIDFPLLDLTNNSKYYYISQLGVSKKFQRQGIGSFLYISLFSYFPQHLFLGIALNENKASLHFQATLGAKIVAQYWKNDMLHGYLLIKGLTLLPENITLKERAL